MQTEITLGLYFLFIVIIGIYSAFRIKSSRDYYVAGKRAGVIQVSGSLLATILGGSAILGTIELSQSIGWAALWFLLSAALGLALFVPLSKYVNRFGNFTLPELLGDFYGNRAKILSSVIIPIAWLGIVAAQIIAAAKILSGLGFITYTNAAIFSGTIFIAYTLLGGQLSILKTDALQSFLIISGLISLLLFASTNSNVINIPSITPQTLLHSSFTFFDLIILVLTYSVTFVVGPDIYSRVFCAKNEKTATQSVLLVALLLIPISFVLTWLGIYSQQVSSEGIISFAESLLPGWAYGLFIAALLSAVMSSADTTLLTSSMIVNELITENLETKKSLFRTRVIVVLIGILSIAISLYITSIIQALLFALTFFSGAFVVPTLAGLLNIKVHKKRVVYAMIVGGIIALTGKITGTFIHDITGNIIIISSYFFNIAILFLPVRKA